MLRRLHAVLKQSDFAEIESAVAEAAQRGDDDRAFELAGDLMTAQPLQKDAAHALIRLVDAGSFSVERSLVILEEIESRQEDPSILAALGRCIEEARDIDLLNDAPPTHPLFARLADRLEHALADPDNRALEIPLTQGLATTTRMIARQRDSLAEKCFKRLVDLEPQSCQRHYGLGLFYKTRGMFSDGLEANRTALTLADEPVEACIWNLGICATGAGDGETALKIWKDMGQKIDMGRFGLPEGRYPQCKVRLAERPLAERNATNDDPGLEETIWIERLSPCHGVIRSVLFQNLGVDYGDVVLFDGAPITMHEYGDEQIPVFPHLSTLHRANYRFFDFAGTQEESRELADASRDLPKDVIIYSHSENYRVLCAACWRDPNTRHEDHTSIEKHVVTGRIAAPPDISVEVLLKRIDDAMSERKSCRIYVPALCEAAGDEKRAAVEQRRFDMLRSN